MSIDYTFLPRECIGKYFNDIEIKGVYEGYRIHEANIFCNIIGLPQIPYYYCFEAIINMVNIDFDNNKYWKLYFELQLKYGENNRELITITMRDGLSTIPISKQYKAYRHWESWGLKELEKVTTRDILRNNKIKRKDIYGDINRLNEIKQDIKKLLWYYKNHYYIFSLV